MAYSKKYNGSTWEHSLRKLNTSTDTITTLPAVLYPTGTTATVGLKGNTTQSGTPTPDNPIMPQGTGERTGNLYNINAHDVNNGYVNNAQLSQDGATEIWGSAEISEYIPISGDTAYTFNGIGSYNSPCYGLYDENKQLIGAYRYNGAQIIKFTSPNNARYFRFTHIKRATRAMMVEGVYTTSTMPDYEPYGYKIPISSANTTTPVYLGEVETTRKIKKLVLDGTENWSLATDFTFRITINGYLRNEDNIPICTHYRCIAPVNKTADLSDGDAAFLVSSSGNNYFYISDYNYTTAADFKSYLAAQYAAGTPVTVWYVLATPTTGIVNEPLMKIGNYADTVSGISIPTITGKDTFDVGTTLKPSEISLSYTDWRDASVQEWDGGQWNQ